MLEFVVRMWRRTGVCCGPFCKSLFKNQESFRQLSLSPNPEITKSAVAVKIAGWMKHYEDVIGLTDVKEAQNRVILVSVTSVNCVVVLVD